MIRILAYKQLGNRSFIYWLRFVKIGDETKTTTNNVVSTNKHEDKLGTYNSVPMRWENVHGVETPICRECGFIPNKKYNYDEDAIKTLIKERRVSIVNPLKNAKLIEVDSRDKAIQELREKNKLTGKIDSRMNNMFR